MGELNLLLALVLKPAVFVFGGLLLVPLYRERHRPGYRLLLLGLLVFLAGELCCGVDVYVLHHMSAMEALHDLAMSLSLAIGLVGLFRATVDARCLMASCPDALGCRRSPGSCGRSHDYGKVIGHLMLVGAVGVTMLVAAEPGILTRTIAAGWGDWQLGTYEYCRCVGLSSLQQTLFPLVSAVALVAGGCLYLKRSRLSRASLWSAALGVGFGAFATLRLALVHFYHPQVVLTAFWEEVLELSAVALLFSFLRQNRTQDAPQLTAEPSLMDVKS